MALTAFNGVALSTLTAFNGIAKSGLTAINGQTIGGGGGSAPDPVDANFTTLESSTDTSSHTLSVNCTGANALYVDVLGLAQSAFTGAFLTATYNGVSMTAVLTRDFNGDGSLVKIRFRLLSPTTGANNFVVTSVGSNFQIAQIGAIPISGVNGTTPEGTSVTNSGSDAAPTVTASSAATEIVLASVISVSPAITGNGAGQTTTYNLATSTNRGTYKTGEASSVSSWTLAGADVWFTDATPVKS